MKPFKKRGPARQSHKGRQPRYGNRLVIMLKDPRAGTVKTRLARETGVAEAVRVYRAMTSALIARLGTDRRWQTILAISPDSALQSRAFPGAIARMPQGSGGLGQRLQRVADRTANGPLLIIGTDIPGISRDHIAAAFRALKGNDAVIGPSPDGGYWLIGLNRTTRTHRPFKNVRWSSPQTRADTLANLKCRRVAEVATLDDIDTASDLKRLKQSVGRRVVPRAG